MPISRISPEKQCQKEAATGHNSWDLSNTGRRLGNSPISSKQSGRPQWGFLAASDLFTWRQAYRIRAEFIDHDCGVNPKMSHNWNTAHKDTFDTLIPQYHLPASTIGRLSSRMAEAKASVPGFLCIVLCTGSGVYHLPAHDSPLSRMTGLQ